MTRYVFGAVHARRKENVQTRYDKTLSNSLYYVNEFREKKTVNLRCLCSCCLPRLQHTLGLVFHKSAALLILILIIELLRGNV